MMGKDALSHIIEIKEMLARVDERMKTMEDAMDDLKNLRASMRLIKVIAVLAPFVISAAAWFGFTIHAPWQDSEVRQ
jgi:hypothetical protein